MAAPKTTTEIVFFDLETTVPQKSGQRFWVKEFGAIVVCPRKLVELESYCTLIRPGDLSGVGARPARPDGITRKEAAAAPPFAEVADEIFKILDGRIWAGHNIQRFDCVRIKEMFGDIDKPAPSPAGIIDSLGVLREKFGRRAGNMKMATLADYFGLGEQKHRSLDDVRMNLEVLKHCATVLFLESSLPPNALNWQWQTNSPNVTTRSKSLLQSSSPTSLNIKGSEKTSRKSPPSTSAGYQRAVPYATESLGKMTARVKNVICSNLLKHSQSLIR
ncbi:protein NEN4-like [Salvia splendens]|uniref:protein NEN4-like n=1 Tax=Salvia splendens TaxID=180675 RepID=UPI001C27DA72|nr:protein NEN4-like [Salvia splendens]